MINLKLVAPDLGASHRLARHGTIGGIGALAGIQAHEFRPSTAPPHLFEADGDGSDDRPLQKLSPPLPDGTTARPFADRKNPGVALSEVYHAYAFLVPQCVSSVQLHDAVERAHVLGADVFTVLITRQYVFADQYVKALADSLGCECFDVTDGVAETTFIDGTSASPADIQERVSVARRQGHRVGLVVGDGYRSTARSASAQTHMLDGAVNRLRRRQPQLSAGQPFWAWQFAIVCVALGGFIGLALTDFARAGQLTVFLAIVPFAAIVVQRAVILYVAINNPLEKVTRADVNAHVYLSDAELPVYSVLVPLFREAAILPDLIVALSKFDYPVSKLDILIVLEESDHETQFAASMLDLPGHFRVVVVPDAEPKTKPKAMNFALNFARGEFVCVFDAEDVPDPNQLRLAATAFRRAAPEYHCLQARLFIANQRQCWISRQFALEYMALFNALLPALWRLNIPIPLGGTSNHFPRAALEKVHGWDPFNVTEDADLGLRFARLGYRVGLLHSFTWEEAPIKWSQWLPQRTRWIKGWMQTYLVHTREPWRALREMGVWPYLNFQLLIGGFLLSVLVHPWLYVMLGLELARETPFAVPNSTFGLLLLTLAGINLVVGFLAAFAMIAIGSWRVQRLTLGGYLVFAPVYWILISIAGYRALVQLLFRPHYWEKTEHFARQAVGGDSDAGHTSTG